MVANVLGRRTGGCIVIENLSDEQIDAYAKELLTACDGLRREGRSLFDVFDFASSYYPELTPDQQGRIWERVQQLN